MTDDALEMWVVYWSPRDYPELFVARKWRILPHELPMPSTDMFTSTSLAELRKLLPFGLINIGRMEGDEPQILEVWT